MRRRLGLLSVTTWLVLAGVVVTAAPAEARRNVGGSVPEGSICLSPGSAQARSANATSVLSCFCVIYPAPKRNVGGSEPAGGTDCPPGILKQEQRPDRNVGG